MYSIGFRRIFKASMYNFHVAIICIKASVDGEHSETIFKKFLINFPNQINI